jgi:hypothetical protein
VLAVALQSAARSTIVRARFRHVGASARIADATARFRSRAANVASPWHLQRLVDSAAIPCRSCVCRSPTTFVVHRSFVGVWPVEKAHCRAPERSVGTELRLRRARSPAGRGATIRGDDRTFGAAINGFWCFTRVASPETTPPGRFLNKTKRGPSRRRSRLLRAGTTFGREPRPANRHFPLSQRSSAINVLGSRRPDRRLGEDLSVI